MEQQQKSKESDEQLHWFWELTTKWWFFPVFYIFLIFILMILWAYLSTNSFSLLGETFGPSLVMMPTGLGYYIQLPIDLFSKEPLSPELGFIFWPVAFIVDLWMIFLMFYIPYCKIKRNIIPKRLIISLYLVIILSLVGFILGQVFPINFRGL